MGKRALPSSFDEREEGPKLNDSARPAARLGPRTFKAFQENQLNTTRCTRCTRCLASLETCKCDQSDDEIVFISEEKVKKGIAPTAAKIVSISMSTRNQNQDKEWAWAGKVTMTAVPNSTSTFHFKDLLQNIKLLEAVFSSFALDPEWLGSFLPPATPFTFATQRPESINANTTCLDINPFIKMIFPPMPSKFGCMHIKLVILFYEGHVRVAVPSANLVEYDWSRIENICYYQDFPRITGHEYIPKTDTFKADLLALLGEMKIPKSTLERLHNYDFSSALGSLVVSKPGQSRQGDAHVYGLLSLSQKAKNLGLSRAPIGRSPYIYCQSSSLGDVTQKWADEFAASIAGKEKSKGVAGLNFYICFPSLATVQSSTFGINGGGTIFAQKKYWIKKSFPRHLIYDCTSTSSSSTLMHSKQILYSTHLPPPSPTLTFIHPSSTLEKDGYLYLGSHNHTRAAWGGFQAKNATVSVSNWEAGVVIPYLFTSTGFPVPFKIPPRAYLASDEPWIMADHLKM